MCLLVADKTRGSLLCRRKVIQNPESSYLGSNCSVIFAIHPFREHELQSARLCLGCRSGRAGPWHMRRQEVGEAEGGLRRMWGAGAFSGVLSEGKEELWDWLGWAGRTEGGSGLQSEPRSGRSQRPRYQAV